MKGRGTASLLPGRHEVHVIAREDDGWAQPGVPPEEPARVRTTVATEMARSIISRNQSPDIPFDQSINPYRGCEHGCVYCYARPSHARLNLSPGLDFETRLSAKVNAAELLRRELARPGYVPKPINLGANTDPFQPIEDDWQLTHQVLEVLLECRHPVTIVSKNGRVDRELPILGALAQQGLVHVFLSVTSLDNRLSATLEPRASAPHRRIAAIAKLSAAGVPASVLVAPVIPAITDAHLEAVLEAARAAGARTAGYTLIRLPWEVRPLFEGWLAEHFPQRAAHVMSLIRQMRDGRANDPAFGSRMKGTGVFAQLIRTRFHKAAARLGYARRADITLDCSAFRPPLVIPARPAEPASDARPRQLSLF